MPVQAQSADGIMHEFPDGTDPSVIDKVMKDYVQKSAKPAAAPAPTEKPGALSALTKPITNIPKDIGEEFSAGTSRVRRGEESLFGKDKSLGERAKGAANIPLGAMQQIGSPVSGAVRSVLTDPVRETKLPGSQTAANTLDLAGGLVGPGGAAKVGGEAVKAAGAGLSMLKKTPQELATSQKMGELSSQLYAKAAQEGGHLKPEFSNKFIDMAEKAMPQGEWGKAVAGNNEVTALAERLAKQRGRPMTLQDVQETDEHLGGLIEKQYTNGKLSKEGQKLGEVQQNFRDMVLGAERGEVEGGKNGFNSLQDGRRAWSQTTKMRDLERIQERGATAAETGGNKVATIKNGIRSILNSPAKRRAYTAEELAALKKAAGTGLVDGALSVVGHRAIPLLAGMAEGGALGGIPGAIAGGAAAHGLTSAARGIGGARQAGRLNEAMAVLDKPRTTLVTVRKVRDINDKINGLLGGREMSALDPTAQRQVRELQADRAGEIERATKQGLTKDEIAAALKEKP